MKIGRNDICPCGSGKKYKQCCLKKTNKTEYECIRECVIEEKANSVVADFLCNLLHYMKEKQWIGACHATSSVLYVGLSELGCEPKICLGEVATQEFHFDHSWIEVNGKIIDLAVSMTLMRGKAVSAPIVYGKDIYSGEKAENLRYGIIGSGIDLEAKMILNMSFGEYMSLFPNEDEGLWGVLLKTYPEQLDISEVKQKYKDVERIYIQKDVSEFR